MAIGTPTSLGTAIAGTTAASSKVFTTNAAIVAGDLVVVAIGWYSSGGFTVSGVVDSGSTNSYVSAVSVSSGGGIPSGVALYYVKNATALASGGTITVTWSGSVASQSIMAYRVTGIDTVSPLDKTSTAASASGGDLSVATGTLGQANEIIFGAAGGYNVGTYTESSGFTSLAQNSPSGNLLALAYDIVSSTSSVTYAPTGLPNSRSEAVVASFKAPTPNTSNFFMFFN
jgi:hypothetical protein